MNKSLIATEIVERFTKNYGTEAEIVVCVFDRTGGSHVSATVSLEEAMEILPAAISGSLLSAGMNRVHGWLTAMLRGR